MSKVPPMTEAEWLAGDELWRMLRHALDVGSFPARKQIQFCAEAPRLQGAAMPPEYLPILDDLAALAESSLCPDLGAAVDLDSWKAFHEESEFLVALGGLSERASRIRRSRVGQILAPDEAMPDEGDPRFAADEAVVYAVLGDVFVCCHGDGMGSIKHSPREADLLRELLGNPFRPCVLSPAWLVPPVRALAVHARASRAFDVLPILADALEEAGCDDAALLTHLRSRARTSAGAGRWTRS